MKYLFSILAIGLWMSTGIAQEFDQQIALAEKAYKGGDIEQARSALRTALNEIDKKVGQDILSLLPGELASVQVQKTADNVTGAGVAGVFVQRTWQGGDKNIEFSVMGNSPLMAGVNLLLNMPFGLGQDPNQKKVTVEGYKALLQKNMDANSAVSGYQVQIPFGASMISVDYKGSIAEADFLALLSAIPVRKIIELAQ